MNKKKAVKYTGTRVLIKGVPPKNYLFKKLFEVINIFRH